MSQQAGFQFLEFYNNQDLNSTMDNSSNQISFNEQINVQQSASSKLLKFLAKVFAEFFQLKQQVGFGNSMLSSEKLNYHSEIIQSLQKQLLQIEIDIMNVQYTQEMKQTKQDIHRYLRKITLVTNEQMQKITIMKKIDFPLEQIEDLSINKKEIIREDISWEESPISVHQFNEEQQVSSFQSTTKDSDNL